MGARAATETEWAPDCIRRSAATQPTAPAPTTAIDATFPPCAPTYHLTRAAPAQGIATRDRTRSPIGWRHGRLRESAYPGGVRRRLDRCRSARRRVGDRGRRLDRAARKAADSISGSDLD